MPSIEAGRGVFATAPHGQVRGDCGSDPSRLGKCRAVAEPHVGCSAASKPNLSPLRTSLSHRNALWSSAFSIETQTCPSGWTSPKVRPRPFRRGPYERTHLLTDAPEGVSLSQCSCTAGAPDPCISSSVSRRSNEANRGASCYGSCGGLLPRSKAAAA